MSEKPISPLRRRMIEDMTVRNFVEKTHNDYIRHVRTFTTFLGRAPDTAAPEDLRLFQLHQTQTGVGASGINGSVAALRFFFTVTLDRPEMARHLTFVREPRKIPVILSLEEIARLLEAAPGPKYKAALSAAYGAGLRVSEVVALKVSLPAGAVAGWDLHPLESAAFARRTPLADEYRNYSYGTRIWQISCSILRDTIWVVIPRYQAPFIMS